MGYAKEVVSTLLNENNPANRGWPIRICEVKKAVADELVSQNQDRVGEPSLEVQSLEQMQHEMDSGELMEELVQAESDRITFTQQNIRARLEWISYEVKQ